MYANDAPAGVWEPGKRIPLLASGTTTVKLIAGIRKNGVTDDRIQYPFYATYVADITLAEEQVKEVRPTFRYYPNLNIWSEDFSGGGVALDTIASLAPLVRYNPHDSAYGGCVLDPTHAAFRCVSGGDPLAVGYALPAFLELDHRNDIPFTVGVRYKVSGIQYQVPYVVITPSPWGVNGRLWNKVYIDLGTPFTVAGATDERFYIEASLPSGAGSARLDLDNIRVIQ
ncbi:MAG: hypothetical protein QM724_07565 [Flavobacteriales bacterium]